MQNLNKLVKQLNSTCILDQTSRPYVTRILCALGRINAVSTKYRQTECELQTWLFSKSFPL